MISPNELASLLRAINEALAPHSERCRAPAPGYHGGDCQRKASHRGKHVSTTPMDRDSHTRAILAVWR